MYNEIIAYQPIRLSLTQNGVNTCCHLPYRLLQSKLDQSDGYVFLNSPRFAVHKRKEKGLALFGLVARDSV